ncbi:Protein EARLY FLOWERING 3 [Forsythia ovata]|uniref:Protein EARLY FLOWERING 3 n=1 Tax=Forsythia ovata TaxID=205694 RepID=A0ABD1WFM5_9LAMI
MVPMFPRLHVNDTDTGGPRAPPRNKMALYEQLSIPSQRFSHGVFPFNPTNTSNLEPPASSSQGTGKERSKFLSHQLPTRHQAEKSHSQYSNLSTLFMQDQQKKKLDEDDFTVPIFIESHSNHDHGKYFNDLDGKFSPSNHADSNHSLKFQKAGDKDPKQTSLVIHSRNQEGKSLKEVDTREFVAAREQLDKALLNLSSINKTEGLRKQIDASQSDEPRDNPANSIDRLQKADCNILPELCSESQSAGSVQGNAVMREPSLGINKKHSSSFRDFPLEEQSIVHNLSDDMTSSREESSCMSPQMGNIDRADSVSETSMVDSVSGLDISPDDVVGKIGQKHFWKARRAIANQQRAFGVQVFELHRLIKVQRLIAASPHLLLEDTAYLDKPIKISPAKKLPLDYIAKAPPNISKRKCNSEKPNPETECSAENTVGKKPLPSVQNGCQPLTDRPFLGNPLSPAESSEHNAGLCYFNQAHGHQWLIPVMSPSEGLVYKPYPGPGFMGPVCGPPGLAPWTSNFSTPGYGVPASNHQFQVSSFPPAGPQGYFPTYGMPFGNPAFSGSSVEQTNHFNIQHQNSCNMPSQTNEAIPDVIKPHAAKNNEIQMSTASSTTERPQGSREGHAMEGRNMLPLFPTSPSVNVPNCSLQSPEPEFPARVIKVMPRNARSATESAARIFRSIQEERKHMGARSPLSQPGRNLAKLGGWEDSRIPEECAVVRDFSVWNSEGDKDSGAGKCPENIWVHVEDLDSVDGGFVLEELCNLSRRREVVSESTIINSDGMHCGEGHEALGNAVLRQQAETYIIEMVFMDEDQETNALATLDKLNETLEMLEKKEKVLLKKDCR